jgi:hypothetical protein
MSSYWAKIEDMKSAQDAALGAAGIALFCTIVSGVLAVLSIIYDKPILGINGWSPVDATLFAVCAWRIWKMSRSWAIVGLLLYLLEVVWRVQNGIKAAGIIVSIIFTLAFVGGVRGTFAFHRYSKEAMANSGAPLGD